MWYYLLVSKKQSREHTSSKTSTTKSFKKLKGNVSSKDRDLIKAKGQDKIRTLQDEVPVRSATLLGQLGPIVGPLTRLFCIYYN